MFHDIVADFCVPISLIGGGGGHVFDSCFIQLACTGHKDTGNGAGTYIVVILLIHRLKLTLVDT